MLRKLYAIVLITFVGFTDIACTKSVSHTYHQGPDDIAKLSDEFDSAGTLSNWKHVYKEERWGANQLQLVDINATKKGALVMVPYASTWYQDYRGVLVFKPIDGDFVMTTRVRATGRDGTNAPRSNFSLAGIMIRTPRDITPETWQPGRENYVFLSLGSADRTGSFQWEVKTTINSDSQLQTEAASGPEGLIQVARIGSALIMLRNSGSGWTVFRRYNRQDMPSTLQAGLTVYADYARASQLPAKAHNGTVIRDGNPDLVAQFDYVRYRRPKVPANLRDKNLSDPGSVSDSQLLAFLGETPAAK